MANTRSRDTLGHEGSATRDTVISYNKLLTKFDALLTKLDADAGVTDTNYTSTLGTASTGGPQKIGNDAGTAITA